MRQRPGSAGEKRGRGGAWPLPAPGQPSWWARMPCMKQLDIHSTRRGLRRCPCPTPALPLRPWAAITPHLDGPAVLALPADGRHVPLQHRHVKAALEQPHSQHQPADAGARNHHLEWRLLVAGGRSHGRRGLWSCHSAAGLHGTAGWCCGRGDCRRRGQRRCCAAADGGSTPSCRRRHLLLLLAVDPRVQLRPAC